jgi:putative nucleotidyltransferase with HDIG domain
MQSLLPFLTHVISLRDPHAENHSLHVNNLASALGRQMGMNSAQLEKLEFAATVHDIGKIAINDFIIHKPGRFTEAEYLMVKEHAGLGARIIEKLGLDPIIAEIILHHHENFDGSGYPNNLKGEQIIFEARIIRITDTYDALTTNRGYRPAYTRKQALVIMEKEQAFFDPYLLETFFKLKRVKKN